METNLYNQPQTKVSVVMPVFNGGRTLSRTLESLFQQDYANWELIAVDDDSSDDSMRILEQFQRRAPEAVRVLWQDHGGGAQARNVGIQNSRGDWIAFLDQDDVWTPDKLTRQCRVMQQNPVEVVFCDFYRFDCATEHRFECTNTELSPFIREMTHHCTDDPNVKLYPARVCQEFLLKGYAVYPSTILATKRLLHQVGLWELQCRKSEDFDFSLKCSKLSSFAYVDEPLVGAGWHDHNMSNNPLRQKEHDLAVLYHHLDATYFDDADKALIRKYLNRRILGVAWNHRERGNFGKARELYLEAARQGARSLYCLAQLSMTLPPFRWLLKK